MPPLNIAGQKFCRLTAVNIAFIRQEKTYWLCKCECGNETTVSLSSLRRPNVSCGCLHKEIQRNRLTKHGMSRTPEYVAWQALHQRCEHPPHPEFKNYGARGIRVCEGWKTFPPFFAAVGKRPGPNLSIDRIDNDGNYSCGLCEECHRNWWLMNCRWATPAEQYANRKRDPDAHLIAEMRRSVRAVDLIRARCMIRTGRLLNP